MAKDWILVRLQRDTHRELCEVRVSMEHAELMGRLELSRDDRDRVSLDEVIRQLIRARRKHRERDRKYQQKKVGKNAEICTPADSEPTFTEEVENR